LQSAKAATQLAPEWLVRLLLKAINPPSIKLGAFFRSTLCHSGAKRSEAIESKIGNRRVENQNHDSKKNTFEA